MAFFLRENLKIYLLFSFLFLRLMPCIMCNISESNNFLIFIYITLEGEQTIWIFFQNFYNSEISVNDVNILKMLEKLERKNIYGFWYIRILVYSSCTSNFINIQIFKFLTNQCNFWHCWGAGNGAFVNILLNIYGVFKKKIKVLEHHFHREKVFYKI